VSFLSDTFSGEDMGLTCALVSRGVRTLAAIIVGVIAVVDVVFCTVK
jgi:hypothetical protein